MTLSAKIGLMCTFLDRVKSNRLTNYSSWEPFEKLRQDVPRLVSLYCQQSGDAALKKMDQALGGNVVP
jgi:hypothetical protein